MDWLGLSVLTLIFWGIWGFFLKIGGLTLSSKSATVYQTIGIIITTLFLLVSMNFKVEFNAKGAIFAVLSGVAVTVGSILFVSALSKGKPSAVLSITALYPAVAILLTVFFLKEPLTAKHIAGIVLALGACVLLAG